MYDAIPSIDVLTDKFCEAITTVIKEMTQGEVKYSKTFQRIPTVTIKPDIGCFTQFNGEYNGLAVINFTSEAVMEIYRKYMITMGIPEEELANSITSSEVTDCIGEIMNQIMGKTKSLMEEKYELVTKSGLPKAIALNSAITLTLDSTNTDNRRIAFNFEGQRFHMELSAESTKFLMKS